MAYDPTIVPWTSPGQEPCCCGYCQDDAWGDELEDTSLVPAGVFTHDDPVWRTPLEPEIAESLRLGEWTAGMLPLYIGVRIITPGFVHMSKRQFGNDYEWTQMSSPGMFTRSDCGMSWKRFDTGIPIWDLGNDVYYEDVTLRGNLHIRWRDGGDGWNNDDPPPRPQAPILYVQGAFSVSNPTFPGAPSGIRVHIDGAAGAASGSTILEAMLDDSALPTVLDYSGTADVDIRILLAPLTPP